MKKSLSALLILGLAIGSSPLSHASERTAPIKLSKISKNYGGVLSVKRSKSIKAAFVTADTTTVTTPVDTRTTTTPTPTPTPTPDTRTATIPSDTRTSTTPVPTPTSTVAPSTLSLTGEQLVKVLELFAKLSTTNNVNTTSNNVLTPITVAPQIVTQTIVTPTVNAPVSVNSPSINVANPTSLQQALALLGSIKDMDDDHK